jgi:hypothetical protein
MWYIIFKFRKYFNCETLEMFIYIVHHIFFNLIENIHQMVKSSTVAQVFYIPDSKDEKKYIIIPIKQRVVEVDNVENEEEYN